MMNSLVSSEIAEDATKGRFVVSDLLKNMNFERDYLQLVKEQRDLEKRMGKEEESLNSIKSQLAGSNVEQIRSLNAERIELERKHGQLKVRLGTIGSKSVTAEGRIRSINTSIGEADAKDRKRQRAEDARGYARRIKGLMEGIREKIIGDVRSQLEKETENFFFNMIWKKEAFSKMEITDTGTEYKISVKSDRDKECLGDLSAGERQVLALAFTAALYNVSGYDVPVIIDTPLGRISDETSEKIAGSLPGYLSDTQVVLLVTDKEYSEAVRKKLSSHVGKEYVLKYDEKTKCSKVMSNV
jgi:DNA sulfur modification protein DndD